MKAALYDVFVCVRVCEYRRPHTDMKSNDVSGIWHVQMPNGARLPTSGKQRENIFFNKLLLRMLRALASCYENRYEGYAAGVCYIITIGGPI
jgi:hypothetical protein